LNRHEVRAFGYPTDRRSFLARAGAFGALVLASEVSAETYVDLDLPGGPSRRALTSAFPQKGEMILQRVRAPLLETPWEVFDRGAFTPNDRFYVRWHWPAIPEEIDVEKFRLTVRGHVDAPISLSLADLMALPRFEIAAVNQCSGNSRGFFAPRVPGGEWGNGAMGNAKWTGARLRDVLDRAGVKPGALAVRFTGLDEPVIPEAPRFVKSLAIDHARDSEILIAYLMNDAPLPLLNGFPLRLVVPGWYATYWTKMLSDIEVLDAPDANFWMKSAYLIPDTPHASVKPGETGFKTVPINRMVPRSFFTNVTDATTVKPGAPTPLRGIAFGGDCGVRAVECSLDQGQSWQAAALGPDEGAYAFRLWTWTAAAPMSGVLTVWVRCTNAQGVTQPMEPNWNGGGYMRNVIEHVQLRVA
jgi:DMSO/TMAO reductase YedYZ molybdopterin-dependent catalytic subunit